MKGDEGHGYCQDTAGCAGRSTTFDSASGAAHCLSIPMPRLPALIGVSVALLALVSQAPGAQKVYSHGNPSSHAQLMLELVNRARAKPSAEAKRHGISLNRGLPSGRISTGVPTTR